MAKYLAQIVITGAQIVGRAFARAVQSEIRASQQAAKSRQSGQVDNKGAAATALTGLSLQEAKQILNVDNIKDIENLTKNYEHLFNINDKKHGGSFYLQSKVVRAKERIDHELQNTEADSTKKTDSSQEQQ